MISNLKAFHLIGIISCICDDSSQDLFENGTMTYFYQPYIKPWTLDSVIYVQLCVYIRTPLMLIVNFNTSEIVNPHRKRSLGNPVEPLDLCHIEGGLTCEAASLVYICAIDLYPLRSPALSRLPACTSSNILTYHITAACKDRASFFDKSCHRRGASIFSSNLNESPCLKAICLVLTRIEGR